MAAIRRALFPPILKTRELAYLIRGRKRRFQLSKASEIIALHQREPMSQTGPCFGKSLGELVKPLPSNHEHRGIIRRSVTRFTAEITGMDRC